MRSLAEMENLRQRTKREVEAAKTFGHQSFAKDIIGVADVLEFALEAVKKVPEVKTGESDVPHTPITKTTSDSNSNANDGGGSAEHRLKELVEGLQMTLQELHRVFSKHGIVAIDPLHQRYDPNLHTALFEVSSSSPEQIDQSETVKSETDKKDKNGRNPPVGIVISVQKKGYTLNGRLLRSASVGISK